MFKHIMGQYVPSCFITIVALVTSVSSYAHYIDIEIYKQMSREQQIFFVMGVTDSTTNCIPNISAGVLLDSLNEVLLESPKEFNIYPANRAIKSVIALRYKCTRV
jgi:hypothetical protein